MAATPVPLRLSEVMPDEREQLREMARLIWNDAYRELLCEAQIRYMLERMYSLEALRRDAEVGIVFDWILADGERAGFLGYGPILAGRCVSLHKFYVLPAHQGRGTGSAAMRALLVRLAEAGVPAVALRVNRNNQRAIGFYGRNGFSYAGEDCLDIGGGFVMDDFLMRREIGD